MEFSQTWKVKATPAGRLYWAHTASGRRTGDNGSTGWPTCTKTDANRHPADMDPKNVTLNHAVMLAGWATPTAAAKVRSEEFSEGLAPSPHEVLALSGWNTPRATDGSHGGPNQSGGALPADAALAGWATPAHRDYRYPNQQNYQDRGGGKKGEQLNNQVAHLTPGPTSDSSPAPTEKRGVLAPEFSRWLMGFPATWDEASPNFDAWREVQAAIESGDSADTETQ